MAVTITSKEEAWDHLVKALTEAGFDDEDITLGVALDEERQFGTGFLADLVRMSKDQEGKTRYVMSLWYPKDWFDVVEDGTIVSVHKTYETRLKRNEFMATLRAMGRPT